MSFDFFFCSTFLIFRLFRTAVHDLNNKYKHCLIMCKQLSGQEELLTCDELKDVSITADKLLYLHATELCFNAASSEFFGRAREVREKKTRRKVQRRFVLVYSPVYRSSSSFSQFNSTSSDRTWSSDSSSISWSCWTTFTLSSKSGTYHCQRSIDQCQ